MQTNDRPTTTPQSIISITCGVFLVVLIGWIVVVGKSILLPMLIGVISIYILTTTATSLERAPLVGRMSQGLRRGLVAILFLISLLWLVDYVASRAQLISDRAPAYAENFNTVIQQVSHLVGIREVPKIGELLTQLESTINVQSVISTLASTLSGFGTFLASAFLYAVFLLADWNDLPNKTRLALGNTEGSQRTLDTVTKINERIGGYLMTKTLINIILAVFSYAVMWFIGIEFAAFWAIIIGLLNYIPYIGSILGVVFPVTLALGQFGSLSTAAIAFVALMGAQLVVGNVIEPKMLGKSVNMSPFVFMFALSFWMTVWGLPGAILAIPLTSIIMIVLAEFPNTRPIAVMMSGDGEV